MAANRTTCPACGGVGLPVLFGLPSLGSVEAAEDRELVLAGCIGWGDERDPRWQCENCGDRWFDDDEARWLAALSGATAGRPRCPECGSPCRMLVYRHAESIFEAEIDSGEADVTDEPPPPGVNARQRCVACDYTWSPGRRPEPGAKRPRRPGRVS